MKYLFLLLVFLVSSAQAKTLKLAIIDGRISPKTMQQLNLDFCPEHGTYIPGGMNIDDGLSFKHANNILETATSGVFHKVCILSYPVFLDIEGVGVIVNPKIDITKAIRQATLDGADVINLSIGGKTQRNDSERLALLYALVHGIKISLAAGNEGLDLSKQKRCDNLEYAACYGMLNGFKKFMKKGQFFVVGNTSKTSNKIPNMTPKPACSLDMCGTSQSTAFKTNELLMSLKGKK